MNTTAETENEFGWLLNPEKLDSNNLMMVVDAPALYRDIERFISSRDTYWKEQVQKEQKKHELNIDILRQHIATLYCAAGCDCCRDTKVWKAESSVIAVMLGIPAYDDGSGFDFYKVRDSYHSELDQDKK